MYDLSGKVALVTGAGGEGGIGRAIATRLAAEGADVIVNDLAGATAADPGWGGVDAVAHEIEEAGRRAIAVLADISDAAQVEDMVRQAVARFGAIDILVNNAASRPGADRVPVVELDEESWDMVHRVNVKGTFLCSRAVARHMIQRGRGGKIVNISSSKGKQGAPLYAAYSASKFAVVGFTQSLALELARHGINVNAVCPGMADTERIGEIAAATRPEGVSAEDYRRQMLDDRAAQVPLGRVADVADVAGMVAFLASAEVDYLTGLAVSVTGGTQMT